MSIKGLPNWSIPDLQPTFFDSESATTIEMVAKLYGKIKELIETYNKFETDLTGKINEAYEYLKTNLHETCMTVINQMIKSGDFYVGVTYEEETESLNIVFSEVNNNE